MFHMRQVKIGESICVLVLLFSGLVSCSGVFGSPLTDDVATLETLSENIPSDYRINVSFLSKNVGGACWLYLNLYEVESSLKTLVRKFGNLSTNRANITIFITMLQGFRSTLDNNVLDLRMQTFKCHYRKVKWPTRRFFSHVKEVLTAAGSMLYEIPDCNPPPCKTLTAPPFTPGRSRQQNGMNGAVHGLLAVIIIPSVALLILTVKLVFRRRGCCAQGMREQVELGLNELHDAAEETTGPHGGALREASPSSQQDRAWPDFLECADTEV